MKNTVTNSIKGYRSRLDTACAKRGTFTYQLQLPPCFLASFRECPTQVFILMQTSFKFTRMAAAVTLLFSASACNSGTTPQEVVEASTQAPVAVTEQEQANVLKQYLELVQMQLKDDRCHWLDATSRVALNATTEERKAWMAQNAPEALPNPEMLETAKAQADAAKCEGENANPDALAVRYGTWQMRATWALRGQALLDGKERPAWFAQQSPVLAYRQALDETVAALTSKFEASITNSQPGIELEATQMLALACPNKPNACPTEAPATTVSKAYAEAWVAQAAIFAAALAKDPVKLPAVPESPKTKS